MAKEQIVPKIAPGSFGHYYYPCETKRIEAGHFEKKNAHWGRYFIF
jgi:hypothetical protein